MSTPGVFSTLGDTMSILGDTMSTLGDNMSVGDIRVHRGFHTNSIAFPMNFPHIYHDIPPVYLTPQCAQDISQCAHVIPQCTAYPPLYCTGIIQGEKA